VRSAVVSAAGRMDVANNDARLIVSLAWASPVTEGATVIDRLAQLGRGDAADPADARLYGRAAHCGA
jgi:hypothetical protein